MKANVHRFVAVARTPRVLQLEGLFDIPPTRTSAQEWTVELPIEEGNGPPWHVGLIVGPSGSGKSTVARELFGGALVAGYDWPADKSLVDGFPSRISIKDVTALLSSVGFSTPPAWLRPFRCLSTGEQFRATVARALAEAVAGGLVVLDEFTSVVDRQVAQIGSAAVAKAVRRRKQQLVAVTCHYDVEEWLQPDWILEMPAGTFTRRLLRRRPAIDLTIRRVDPAAWQLFKQHHYLNTSLHRQARCFVAYHDGRPAAFASSIHMAGKNGGGWREHRTVCLPDFQGVGIGNALSEFVAGVMRALGKPYFSDTGNPAMIAHRARSPLWLMHRRPSLASMNDTKWKDAAHNNRTAAVNRLTAGFRYVGPVRLEEARAFGLV